MSQDQAEETLHDYNAALRERLNLLIERSSRSEIARKTDTAVSNVIHYAKGRKVPAEFCCSLVENVGVNPMWLMGVEGSAYISDVSEDAATMATDLLALIESMNNVSKMKLGALVSTASTATVHKLEDILKVFDQLKERLHGHSLPIARRLLKDIEKASARADYATVVPALKAAAQVLRLCDDEALTLAYDRQRAFYEYHRGHPDEALALTRSIMLRSLACSQTVNEDHLADAGNYASALFRLNRGREARKICRSALVLADELAHTPTYFWLLWLDGLIDFALGDVWPGLSKAQQAYAQMGEKGRDIGMKPVLLRMVSICGMLGPGEALSAHPTPIMGNVMIKMAYARGSLKELEQACALYLQAPEQPATADPVSEVRARCLLRIFESGGKRPLADFRNSKPLQKMRASQNATDRYAAAALLSQMAWIAKDFDLARKEFETSEREQAQIPSHLHLSIISMAFHHANALYSFDAESQSPKHIAYRECALAFFREYYDKGCGYFVNFLPQLPPAEEHRP